MKSTTFLGAALLAATLFAASPSQAQHGNPANNPGSNPGTVPSTRDQGNKSTKTTKSNTTNKNESDANASASTADRSFVAKAASGGMAEVKLGKLAEEKGSSQSAKDFGKGMVEDHSKTGDQLKEVAKEENIDLPSDLNTTDQAQYDRLSKLSGAAFDRAYAKAMVDDHTKDVSEFQHEGKTGKDDAIKEFASKTTPTLEDHLKQAREMQKDISQTSSKTNNSNKTSKNAPPA
jgi:putative membrane protein